ncbi:hypothetical protein ACI65C_007434 [Semiaphis heraclei]
MSSECDGVVYAICTDKHNLRDYHRSAKRPGQTVGVVAGNAAPPAAAGPEVHQAYRPMAPRALRQPLQLQQQSNGGGNAAGLVSVSSRKNRKLQDVLLSGKRVPEKWIIVFLAVVSCIGLVLTVIKIQGGKSKNGNAPIGAHNLHIIILIIITIIRAVNSYDVKKASVSA